MTDCRRQCVWRAERYGEGSSRKTRTAERERRGDGKMKREVGWMNAVFIVVLLGSAGVVRSQETRSQETQAQETQAQETQEGPPPPMVMIQAGTVGSESGTVM